MLKWLAGFGVAASLLAQGQSANGNWTGEISAGGFTLHFKVHLEQNGGVWDSVDEGAKIPVRSVQVTGNSVAVGLGIARFEGVFANGGQEIQGKFQQGGATIPLTLKRFAGEFAAPKRPQEPLRPFPYTEEDVKVDGPGGLELAGTFTRPKAGGPFATAILLSGSGPQDRDEALMGHRPFLVLSDFLTRAGFGVLRLDDRGTGKSKGIFAKTTYADKTADVQAAVRYLKSRTDVDAARIGVIGHSEGGTIGPMAAAESHDIAFVVMMAGMGVPGVDLLKQQGIDVTRATPGATEEMVAKQVEVQGQLFTVYREAKSPEEARKRVHEKFGDSPQVNAQIQAMESVTFRELLALDPRPVLRNLSCPVLALNGSRDTQVSAKQNLPAIAAALSESKSRDWQVMELPNLNHLFQTAKTGGVSEYSQIEETIAPTALRAINQWLTERFLLQK
jgi:pimeloyl-ACP methyl ester carboxylesterase